MTSIRLVNKYKNCKDCLECQDCQRWQRLPIHILTDLVSKNQNGWGRVEMWDVLKILLLCLIFVLIIISTSFWLSISVSIFVLTYIFYDFDFSTCIKHHVSNKFKNLYLKVRSPFQEIYQIEQNTLSFQYTPKMNNNYNRKSSEFSLSKFNKSGNTLSTITKNSNNIHPTSRRLIQYRHTSTPLSTKSILQKYNLSPTVNRTPFSTSLSSVNSRFCSPKRIVSLNEMFKTPPQNTRPLSPSNYYNVSTYPDVKSPSQFNNSMADYQTSTHNPKYSTVGQFPIVHMRKKELPVFYNQNKRCMVRVAPPDHLSYSSDYSNSILRENSVNSTKSQENDSEINTKSVLEALSEISRKRIHSTDDSDDVTKRQRKNSIEISASAVLIKDGKRMREESPPKVDTTSNTPKRICAINEFEASSSSSKYIQLQMAQKRKCSNDIPEANKQRKLSEKQYVSRQTQTDNLIENKEKPIKVNDEKTVEKTTENETVHIDAQKILEEEKNKKKRTVRSIDDIDEENSTIPFAKFDGQTGSLFDKTPLEIFQKNKLAMIVSALGGEKQEITPLPVLTLSNMKQTKEEMSNGSGVTTSILSTKNKLKHNKHVTFALSNSDEIDKESLSDNTSHTPASVTTLSTPIMATSSANSTPVLNNLPNASTSIIPNSSSTFISISTSSVQQTIAFGSITSSSSIVKSVSSLKDVTATTVSTNTVMSPSVNDSEKQSNSNLTSNPLLKSFQFGTQVSSATNTPSTSVFQLSSPTTSSLCNSSPAALTSAATSLNSQPISFGSVSNTNTTIASNVNNFELISSQSNQTTNTTTTTTSSPLNMFNFPTKTTSTAVTPGFTLPTATQSQPKAAGFKFTFGKSSPSKTDSTNSVTETATTVASVFGGFNAATTSAPAFGALNTSTTSAPAFGLSTSAPTFGLSTTTSINAPAFGSTTSAPHMFGSLNTAVTTAPAFGSVNAVSTSAPTFSILNTSTTVPTFGLSNSTMTLAPTFGSSNVTTTAAPTFSSLNTKTTFGISNTTSTVAPTFNLSKTVTTTAPTFGLSNSNTATLTFGLTNTTTSAAPTFNLQSTTTTVTPSFGLSNNTTITTTTTTPNFGNTANIFGGTSTPNSRLFSSPSLPSFTSVKPITSASSASTFGSSAQTPSFGIPTTQKSTGFNHAFGSTIITTTATNTSTFNSSAVSKPFTFGAAATTTTPNAFGTATTTNIFSGSSTSGFGAASASTAFGSPATTTAQNTFGQVNSAPTFGTPSSGFGSTTFANTSGNTFGNQQINTFGGSAPTTSNSFGNNSNTSQGTNVFGAANTNSSSFGSANTFGSGFGATSPQPSTFGGFGTAPVASPSGSVFSFGGAAQNPAPSVAPSSSTTFQFGANAQTPKPAGFNFAATNAANLNFNSGAPPAFGATPTPSFNAAPAQGQFNPSNTMFNIGSGSTAAKPRQIIKARRRN